MMIRKQIYLDERHNEMVRKIAASRGISEAEVIRESIDAQGGRQTRRPTLDPKAWTRALKLMLSVRPAKGRTGANRKKWKREELYEDRLKRDARHTR